MQANPYFDRTICPLLSYVGSYMASPLMEPAQSFGAIVIVLGSGIPNTKFRKFIFEMN